ncbi:hypothetical protein [Streptomyces sp. DSM 40907]|nr:hypothetical protein [Streptomyces sp. DSM 40907]
MNIGPVSGRAAFAMPWVHCATTLGADAFAEALRVRRRTSRMP